MVYTASGQPLYLPPHARKQTDRNFLYHVEQDVLDNGMQSLLSAIELDISHGGTGSDYFSGPSINSSFVDSPDHQELMADLLGTSFAIEEDLSHSGCLSNTSAALPLDPGNDQDTQHSMAAQMFLSQQYTDTMALPPPPPVPRQWSGVHKIWHDKARRDARLKSVIADHLELFDKPVVNQPSPRNKLTRMTFAWPAVAQKSYGHEKRLLTPFPICTIQGRARELCGDTPLAHLTIVPSDSTMSTVPCTANFDSNRRLAYKYLHISNDGIGRSKAVNFKFHMAQNGSHSPSEIPLLEFSTPSIILLSKPSKRTSRLKLQSSFIYTETPVSLFSRINSQTVRTKYLTLEDDRLSVESDSWSSFSIHSFESMFRKEAAVMRPLLYGEKIVLKHVKSGFVSDPLIVRRLEGKVIVDGPGGNISQMQKIVLEKVLDASQGSSAMPGESGHIRRFLSAREAQKPRDLKSYNVLSLPFTDYEPATVCDDGSGHLEIDDAGHWTIVGVASREYTFLDTLSLDAEGPDDRLSSTDSDDARLSTTEEGKRKRSRTSTTEEAPALDSESKKRCTVTAQATIDSGMVQGSESAVKPPTSPPKSPATSDVLQHSAGTMSAAATTNMHVQIPLAPFPSLLSAPIYLPSSNRLHLQIRDFWQTSSLLKQVEIYLGAHGPLVITALQQSPVICTDAALEVELPSREEVGRESVPLLFVREDGIVTSADCVVHIPPPPSSPPPSIPSASRVISPAEAPAMERADIVR